MPGSESSAPIGTTTTPRPGERRGMAPPQSRQNDCAEELRAGQIEIREQLLARGVAHRIDRPSYVRRVRRRRAHAGNGCNDSAASRSAGLTTRIACVRRRTCRPSRPRASDATASATRAPHRGGYASCCGRPSAICVCKDFDPTKMCICGRMPGSCSNAPAGKKHSLRLRVDGGHLAAAHGAEAAASVVRRLPRDDLFRAAAPMERRQRPGEKVTYNTPWCLRHTEQ